MESGFVVITDSDALLASTHALVSVNLQHLEQGLKFWHWF